MLKHGKAGKFKKISYSNQYIRKLGSRSGLYITGYDYGSACKKPDHHMSAGIILTHHK